MIEFDLFILPQVRCLWHTWAQISKLPILPGVTRPPIQANLRKWTSLALLSIIWGKGFIFKAFCSIFSESGNFIPVSCNSIFYISYEPLFVLLYHTSCSTLCSQVALLKPLSFTSQDKPKCHYHSCISQHNLEPFWWDLSIHILLRLLWIRNHIHCSQSCE